VVWASAITRTLAEPGLHDVWRAAARRTAEGYGWDATAEQVLKVYALAAQRR
jgi:D-inositol-3-phosphate glycosyltransferase